MASLLLGRELLPLRSPELPQGLWHWFLGCHKQHWCLGGAGLAWLELTESQETSVGMRDAEWMIRWTRGDLESKERTKRAKSWGGSQWGSRTQWGAGPWTCPCVTGLESAHPGWWCQEYGRVSQGRTLSCSCSFVLWAFFVVLGHSDTEVGTGVFVLLHWERNGSKRHLGNFFTFWNRANLQFPKHLLL